MNNMTFTEWLNLNQDSDNILAPPMNSQTAIQFLADYLLGPGWYISYSCGPEQANTEIVGAILEKYSKKYKKEVHCRRMDDAG